jgi:hypothetical protein
MRLAEGGGIAVLSVALACGGGNQTETSTGSASITSADATSSDSVGSSSSASASTSNGEHGTSSADTTSSSSEGGPIFDVGALDESGTEETGMVASCKVNDDGDAPSCTQTAPPDAFEPEVQWSYMGPGTETESFLTPLVANLTDDDGNGEIDLCDIPDVLVLLITYPDEGHIYVLDGADGSEQFVIDELLTGTINPAIGDIDNDGLPEIIAATGPTFGGPSRAIAFEHDGTEKWHNTTDVPHSQGGAIAIADLDNDGDPEILMDRHIIDSAGNTLVSLAEGFVAQHFTPVAADLDDDGDLEVIMSGNAYHHDGSVLFSNPSLAGGFAQVANLDDEPGPEVLIASDSGISILEADGTVKYQNQAPGGGFGWFRPNAVHDFDGDGEAEFGAPSANLYSVLEGNLGVLWAAPVVDASGWAGSTAFDFDGNGQAEAMYADETNLYVFDGSGNVLLSVPRSSRTLAEYPVVADVDNDGSAEIVVVSDAGWSGVQSAPSVQVIRDVEDRWIQARRIWNQHTYHVTNVREDSTIPQNEQHSWEQLNTFRTNSQIEGGSVCMPPPAG